MSKKEFNSASEFFSFVETLVEKKIDEIQKHRINDFSFRVNNRWYHLTFNYELGTPWGHGKCLVLQSGDDVNRMRFNFSDSISTKRWKLGSIGYEMNHFQFEEETPVQAVFNKLEILNARLATAKINWSKDLLINIIEFIQSFDRFQKIDSNTFLISKSEEVFYFHKATEFVDYKYLPELLISKANGRDVTILHRIKDQTEISEILQFLDMANYLASKKESDFMSIKRSVAEMLVTTP